jgi:hypothetical protein
VLGGPAHRVAIAATDIQVPLTGLEPEVFKSGACGLSVPLLHALGATVFCPRIEHVADAAQLFFFFHGVASSGRPHPRTNLGAMASFFVAHDFDAPQR